MRPRFAAPRAVFSATASSSRRSAVDDHRPSAPPPTSMRRSIAEVRRGPGLLRALNQMATWVVALSPLLAAQTEVVFEEPVLVGQSVGFAVNASCGVGRFWFPQAAAAVDSTTLVAQVSLGADTHSNECAHELPTGLVYTSTTAGRSWKPAWFVATGNTMLQHWRGLRPGPSFCGAAGLFAAAVIPGAGAGIICPGLKKAHIDHLGVGVLELNASWWRPATGLRGQSESPPVEVRPVDKVVVFECPRGLGIPTVWMFGGPVPVRAPDAAWLRLGACCQSDCEAHSPVATQVIFRSLDGWDWQVMAIVPRWSDNKGIDHDPNTTLYSSGFYPRTAEIALAVIDQQSLLIVNRITTDLQGAQHKYVNYTMLWSDSLNGSRWERWPSMAHDGMASGGALSVSRSMLGQWSVLPRMQPLPNGEVILSGGRPGVFLWIGGRHTGRQWQTINICEQHNKGVDTLRQQGRENVTHWTFAIPLASLTPTTALTNQQRSCCPHPNCIGNGAWCQSTAYTSLIPIPIADDHDRSRTTHEYVLLYDRLANGWGGPPGEWGDHDRVFSLRFRLAE